jgi:hypothetical protein
LKLLNTIDAATAAATATPPVFATMCGLMPVIVATRPKTLLELKVGRISVAKKSVGYDKVMLPPAGRDVAVVNDSVTNTPLLEATRSLMSMVNDTLLTCPPELTLAVG